MFSFDAQSRRCRHIYVVWVLLPRVALFTSEAKESFCIEIVVRWNDEFPALLERRWLDRTRTRENSAIEHTRRAAASTEERNDRQRTEDKNTVSQREKGDGEARTATPKHKILWPNTHEIECNLNRRRRQCDDRDFHAHNTHEYTQFTGCCEAIKKKLCANSHTRRNEQNERNEKCLREILLFSIWLHRIYLSGFDTKLPAIWRSIFMRSRPIGDKPESKFWAGEW